MPHIWSDHIAESIESSRLYREWSPIELNFLGLRKRSLPVGHWNGHTLPPYLHWKHSLKHSRDTSQTTHSVSSCMHRCIPSMLHELMHAPKPVYLFDRRGQSSKCKWSISPKLLKEARWIDQRGREEGVSIKYQVQLRHTQSTTKTHSILYTRYSPISTPAISTLTPTPNTCIIFYTDLYFSAWRIKEDIEKPPLFVMPMTLSLL